jgi:hypothetical protein
MRKIEPLGLTERASVRLYVEGPAVADEIRRRVMDLVGVKYRSGAVRILGAGVTPPGF